MADALNKRHKTNILSCVVKMGLFVSMRLVMTSKNLLRNAINTLLPLPHLFEVWLYNSCSYGTFGRILVLAGRYAKDKIKSYIKYAKLRDIKLIRMVFVEGKLIKWRNIKSRQISKPIIIIIMPFLGLTIWSVFFPLTLSAPFWSRCTNTNTIQIY